MSGERCQNCSVVPGYKNPNDPEEQEYDLGGENRIHGKINHEKKMIDLRDVCEIVASITDEAIVIEEIKDEMQMICFVEEAEFNEYIEFSWGHATDKKALTMDELEKIAWTSNLDSMVDYKVPVVMPLMILFAILENIRRHYKKTIFRKDNYFYI